MDTSKPVPPPRKRRIWRWFLGLFILLLVLGIGAYLVLRWLGDSDLQNVLAELDRTDPGWRLEEIEAQRKVIPAEKNSALQTVAIKRAFGGLTFWTPGMEKIFPELPPQTQLNDQQVAYLEKALAKFHKAIVLARALKDMPEGRHSIKYAADGISTLIPERQDVREVIHVLQWDACRRVHAFDADGALESCLALLHAARSIGDEPISISQLIRYVGDGMVVASAERTLAQGQPSEISLKVLQAGIEQEIRELSWLPAIRGERAALHRAMQAIAEAKKMPNYFFPALGLNDPEPLLLWHLPGYLAQQHAELLRFMNELVAVAHLPEEKQQTRFQALEETRKTGRGFVKLLAPAFQRIAESHCRTQAKLRCTAAALAAERFRLVHMRWPVDLEELVKGKLLDSVPFDPYDAKPLRLKKTGDGLVIYSVGRDRQDKGGNIDRKQPPDPGPGTDLGFQLWDVAFRRGPPLPPVALDEQDFGK